jgi:two-component system phosphate regulon sensor histidine kinase PhoR
MQGRPLLEAVVDVGIEEFLRAESRATSPGAWREFEIARGKFTTVALRSATDNGWWLLAHDDSEVVRLRRIRTEFIENLSHELRTPVTAIGLIAELLAADTKGSSASSAGAAAPKVRERILQLESESIHLGQMINELLDLARIESGEGMHRNDEIDVAEIVRSAADRLAPFAAQAKVAVKIESPESVKLAPRGNLARLSQVVVNLLHNAIKFSSPGGAVEVRVIPSTSSDVNAKIVVNDHGTGIARVDLDRVFERFFIADRARSKGGGTGLGLSIARHIVEAHGGDISAISTLGEGSTFTITLPSR